MLNHLRTDESFLLRSLFQELTWNVPLYMYTYISGVTGYNFQIKLFVFLSLKIVFVLSNSADPTEMLHYSRVFTVYHILKLLI